MNRIQPISPSTDHSLSERQKQTNRKFLIAGGLAITVIAIPIICSLIQQLTKPCNPSSNFNISTKKPEEHAEYCRRFTDGITEIDGTSIQDIENVINQHGIFGKRTFKEKLFQDCVNVQKMGTTNAELADHLEKIREATGSHFARISYNPALHKNSTIGQCSQMQSLQIGEPIAASCCVPMGQNVFNESVIPCHEKIENLKNKAYAHVSDKIISRIRKYGFFDGFSPVDLGAILTGHSADSIHQAIGNITEKSETNHILSSTVVGEKTWDF